MHYTEENTDLVFCDCCKEATHKDDIKMIWDCSTRIKIDLCLGCYQHVEQLIKDSWKKIPPISVGSFSSFLLKSASEGISYTTVEEALGAFRVCQEKSHDVKN